MDCIYFQFADTSLVLQFLEVFFSVIWDSSIICHSTMEQLYSIFEGTASNIFVWPHNVCRILLLALAMPILRHHWKEYFKFHLRFWKLIFIFRVAIIFIHYEKHLNINKRIEKVLLLQHLLLWIVRRNIQTNTCTLHTLHVHCINVQQIYTKNCSQRLRFSNRIL